MDKRKRLSPEVRKAQIVESAATIVLRQGCLPIPLEQLAIAAGVSKALIYAYFPTQQALFNVLLARELRGLNEAGLGAASNESTLIAAALACAGVYFEQIARRGPLIHLILRDHFMRGHLTAENRWSRDQPLLHLARAARREMRLSAKETAAALNLIMTIPEEAGRLAWSEELDPTEARTLMQHLVRSSIAALHSDDASTH